jgi:hypothetical protein
LFIAVIGRSTEAIASIVVDAVGAGIYTAIQVAFWLTAVFVVLERSSVKPSELYGQKAEPWTPEKLPPLPQEGQIDRHEVIGSLTWTVAGAILVILAVHYPLRGNNIGSPLLNPDLWPVWMTLFLALSALAIVRDICKYAIGKWTSALLAFNVGLHALAIAFVISLISTQDVVNPAFITELAAAGVEGNLHQAAVWTVGLTAAGFVGAYIWDAIISVRQYLARQRS